MRFEALDITIETRRGALWVFLSGPFHREQVPNIREELTGLIDDGNHQLVIDLEQVSELDESAPPMFIELLNLVRGKRGELRLVFRNRVVSEAFAAYRNIIPISPDAQSLARREFLGVLGRGPRFLSRKTGVRLSIPVALVLLFVVVGWFLTLAYVIRRQDHRIQKQEVELRELTVWKEQTLIELNELQERLEPMEQLGILEGPVGKSTK